MRFAFEALIDKAQQEGWAAAKGSLRQVQIHARVLGLTEVPARCGNPVDAALRPLKRADAPANSLSARYGAGEQPLHTDGPHLEQPPDLVILECQGTSATPTRLWRPRRGGRGRAVIEAESIRHGIFLVHNGAESFFSAAFANGRFRYDPGCMTPCDARARQAVRYFENALKSAVEHRWDQAGTVLVIDNRRVLHARASAEDEPEGELQRIAYRLKDDA